MQHLVIRPRWLVMCGAFVILLLVVSVSTGMALGTTPSGPIPAGGFAASGQGACSQTGFGGHVAANVLTDPGIAIASALKLSVGQLQQALSSGQTLSQVVSAHDMTNKQVIDAVTSQQQDQLDQLVANGRVTLDQEDAMLASEQARIVDVLSGKIPLALAPTRSTGFGQGRSNASPGGRGRFQPCGG